MIPSTSSSPELSSVPHSSDAPTASAHHFETQDDVLEDLLSRFILNLPDDEIVSKARISFQVEQAHWYYEDFIREANPKFPSLPLKRFSEMLFNACELLHGWDHEDLYREFMEYKTRVPVCGAIMLNPSLDKCILVKGWKSSSGWGFPKGKINEGEAPDACAAREVYEETGYNLQDQINPEDVIEVSIRQQQISLYIVPNVPEDFPFETRTRKEISKIEWFRLADLPTWKRHNTAIGKFYLITPFISALRTFVNENKPRARKKPKGKVGHPSQANVPVVEPSVLRIRRNDDHIFAQESSSSSAENNGPKTPSPQHHDTLPHSAAGLPVATEDQIASNPELARLLGALNGGSTAVPDAGKPLPALTTLLPLFPSSTPAPQTASSYNSSPERPLTQARANDRAQSSHKDPEQTALGKSMSQSSTRPAVAPLNLPINNGLEATPSVGTSGLPSAALSSMSGTSHTTTSGSAVSPTARRSVSRRSSSTTDLSPYLSRPPIMPTSGKDLQRVALLENLVVDIDSSAPPRPIVSSGDQRPPDFIAPPMGNRTTQYPGSPASVPPPVFDSAPPFLPLHPSGYNGVMNGVNGSNPQLVGPLTPNSSFIPHRQPTFPPAPQQYLQDDAFRVRPHTSNNFHPHTLPFSDPALIQAGFRRDQLLATLLQNGSHTYHAPPPTNAHSHRISFMPDQQPQGPPPLPLGSHPPLDYPRGVSHAPTPHRNPYSQAGYNNPPPMPYPPSGMYPSLHHGPGAFPPPPPPFVGLPSLLPPPMQSTNTSRAPTGNSQNLLSIFNSGMGPA